MRSDIRSWFLVSIMVGASAFSLYLRGPLILFFYIFADLTAVTGKVLRLKGHKFSMDAALMLCAKVAFLVVFILGLGPVFFPSFFRPLLNWLG